MMIVIDGIIKRENYNLLKFPQNTVGHYDTCYWNLQVKL